MPRTTGNLYLKVEVAGGSPIDATCEEAVALADRIGIPVLFYFNDIICCAHPGDNAALLASDWRNAAFEKRRHA